MTDKQLLRELLSCVRRHCWDCNGGFKGERSMTISNRIRDCNVRHCDLWPYRMGRAEEAASQGPDVGVSDE